MTPDAAALIHAGRTTSYAALDQAANRLAHHLIGRGVGPGVLAGVCLHRTPHLIVAILAILKAGGAYLPLDPAYPTQRLDFMLADSGAMVLVADIDLAALDFAGMVVDPSRDAEAIAHQPATAAAVRHGPRDLAYVIYTSGSTGQPKGVALGHSAAALVEWARTTFADGELARVAATTSVCFDPSILEIFAPLGAGGAVILKQDGLEPFGADERPTMLNGVPSVLAEVIRGAGLPNSVRVINIGGEPLSAAFARQVYERTGAERVYNHYGPTEATTCTTVALVARSGDRDPPIGKPIAGARVLVVDADGGLAQDGALGEICIGGPVLAQGYLNRSELTAERFREDGLGLGAGRLYRTGDLGRWSPDGDLEFAGRLDEQVKVRGFRVELGEIESQVARLTPARRCVAAMVRDADGHDRLVCFVECDDPLTLAQLRAALRPVLPDALLPSGLTVATAFPLTLSGKVDRAAVARLPVDPAPAPATADYVPPVEETVVETFKEVLGRAHLGLDDSFFDHGGDSLLAVRAALQLEARLGQTIPSTLIHHAPSANGLAAALSQYPLNQPHHLSVLQPQGDGPPVVCLPDLFSRPLSYLSLARRLAPDIPVWGLSPGPLDAAMLADPSVDLLTQGYLQALPALVGGAPRLICGYSAAGIAAFDLARALEARGERVCLILIEAAIKHGRPPPWSVAAWGLRQLRQVLGREGLNQAVAKARDFPQRWRRRSERVTVTDVPDWVPGNSRRLAYALMRAHAGYRFEPFGGSVLFIRSDRPEPMEALLDHDGMLGWRGLFSGPVQAFKAQAGHYAMMRDPHVAVLADEIRRFAAAQSRLDRIATI